jgi:hypothetical protein
MDSGNAASGRNGDTNKNIVVLCGVQGCCPEVEKKPDGSFEIRDDFGGKVTLTADQYNALRSASFA